MTNNIRFLLSSSSIFNEPEKFENFIVIYVPFINKFHRHIGRIR